MSSPDCPFCEIGPRSMLARNAHAFSFYDGYPVSPGHVLVVPRRHDLDLFELTKEEQQAVFELVAEMRDFILAEHRPDGVNVGINIGEAAGQTVGHAPVHLIPRYQGDLPDPRGGVRWVIPEKADYWSMGGGGPSNSAG